MARKTEAEFEAEFAKANATGPGALLAWFQSEETLAAEEQDQLRRIIQDLRALARLAEDG